MSTKLSGYKVKKIIACFCEDIDAIKTSDLLGINRNTINRYYNRFREAVYHSLSRACLPEKVNLNWTNLTLAPAAFGVNEAVERLVKPLFFG